MECEGLGNALPPSSNHRLDAETLSGLVQTCSVPMMLSEHYNIVAQRLEDRITSTSVAGGSATHDLLIAVAHELEKHLWMLRSLQLGGQQGHAALGTSAPVP